MSQMPIIGVMGGSVCDEDQYEAALKVGRFVAEKGAVLLCGGGSGVMEASAKGALENDGITLGILQGTDKKTANKYIKIAIPTNMGDARNAINILAADIIIAIGGSAGTLSEIALALKKGDNVYGYKTCTPQFSDGKIPRNFKSFDDIDILLDAVTVKLQLKTF